MTPTDRPAAFCEQCGRRAAPDARFCGGCGRPLGAAVPSPPAAPDDGPEVAGPDAADAADASAPGGDRTPDRPPAADPNAETEVVTFRPLAVGTFLELLVCVLTLGLGWVVLRILRLRASYRLTSQRLEIRSGILTVRRRTIDLFRVHDLEIREPLFLRLRAAGDLLVRSDDAGEPELLIHAVPDIQTLHDTLRRLVREERRRHNVRVVEES